MKLLTKDEARHKGYLWDGLGRSRPQGTVCNCDVTPFRRALNRIVDSLKEGDSLWTCDRGGAGSMPPYKGHAKATRIIETQNCGCSDNLGGGVSWELLN